MATSSAAVPQPVKIASKRHFGGDEVACLFTLLFAVSILAITVLLVWELWVHSSPAKEKFGLGFIASSLWNPVTDQFGALPFIYGTVITSAVALLISVPLGVGAAIYLSELALPRVSTTLTFLVELLAAVPSVIFGLLAIFTLVPLMRDYVEPAVQSVFGSLPLFSGHIYGVGYLTAGVILAIMTFPFIISVSREALMAVPREQPAKPRSLLGLQNGNPPPTRFCPSPASELWVPCFLLSPGRSERPWQSPWSSAATRPSTRRCSRIATQSQP